MLFQVIEGAQAVLRSKGVFRQVPVYQRGSDLYAKASGGFVGLRHGGGTTKPDVLWDHIEGVAYQPGSVGKLMVTPPREQRRAA